MHLCMIRFFSCHSQASHVCSRMRCRDGLQARCGLGGGRACVRRLEGHVMPYGACLGGDVTVGFSA